MNNKGFIATSLIYSFFLIFITLFLTIIADYLQNKVLLNTIENGIKDNINNTKSIEDFDVGDIINNVSGSEIYGMPDNSSWIVAAINFDNKKTTGDESKLILYKITPDDTVSNKLTKENIEADLKTSGNYNETRLNELILNSDENYILPNDSGQDKILLSCTKITIDTNDKINIDNSGCVESLSVSKYRERKVIDEWNDKRVTVNPDSFNGITITGEAS